MLSMDGQIISGSGIPSCLRCAAPAERGKRTGRKK
jgi:hypothetical protein